MKRPNILLLLADQMRGDCLGIAGHPDVQTPYLDSLAAKGVRFSRAYSACPSCVPARAALYTGLSQDRHGKVGYADGSSWDYPFTIASELSRAGYHTHCAGKLHVHPPRKLMGFHSVDLHDGYLHAYRGPEIPFCQSQGATDDYLHWLRDRLGAAADVTDTGMECNGWVARPWIYEERYHPTNWVTDRCLNFLRVRDREKPFFLLASYLRPHPPFDAPGCYFDLYRNRPLRGPALGDWESGGDLERLGRIYDSPTGPVDEALIREALVGYYACVTHLDHQIGRLIQALVEEGVWENTWVVFTSDHGEALCDHRLFRKYLPYEGSSHIPLLVTPPGDFACAGRGRVCSAVVELRDVLPTLLEGAGAPIPAEVDGGSLLPLVADPDRRLRAWLHGEHELGPRSNHFIVTETDKYLWYSQTGREQYFDLARDPRELHDGLRDPEYQGRVAYLRGCLTQALRDREEGFVQGGRLTAGRPTRPILEKSILTGGTL